MLIKELEAAELHFDEDGDYYLELDSRSLRLDLNWLEDVTKEAIRARDEHIKTKE